MPQTKKIKVIKIFLPENKKNPNRPKAFPRMPRLYLELLENKAKIKQDLINKEYSPKQPVINIQQPPKKDDVSTASDIETPVIENYKRHDKQERNNEESISEKSESEDESKNSEDSEDSEDSEESGDDLSNRLKELLEDDTDTRKKKKHRHRDPSTSEEESISAKHSHNPHHKYAKRTPNPIDARSNHITPYNTNAPLNAPNIPPTLAELEQKGHYQGRRELRDLAYTVKEDQEALDKKREMLFKFELLKKSYPNTSTNIPEFTINSGLEDMKKEYDSVVRRLSLDSTVESYKQYLIGGFAITEYVFGNFLGFDMQGFTQQQIVSMSSYERLLIELGEKSYVPTGSKWPVELRLLFMIIINAAIFIVGKIIMRKTGANLLGMMNNMSSSTSARPTHHTNQTVPPKRHRMRGPNIDLDDIPEVAPNAN